MIKTCWLQIDGKFMPEQALYSLDRTQRTCSEESTSESEESFDKHSNLVNWHTEMLASFLKVLVAQQQIEKTPQFSDISLDALEWAINEEEDTPIEKLKGNLHFPEVMDLEKTLKLAEEVEGILKASDISRDKVEDARNSFKVGDTVEAKIISVDRKNRGLALSIKAKDYDDEQEAVKSLKEKEVETTSPGTIGDLIKAQMGEK